MDNNPPIDTNMLSKLETMARDQRVTYDELSREMERFLHGANYKRTPYKMHFGAFYRARAGSFDSIDSACLEFGHVNKLSFPPDKFAQAGRCNPIGSSVFYCSTENCVPVFEIRPQQGQYVVIAGFRPKNGNTLDLILPIIGVKQIRESLMKRDPSDSMIKMLSEDMHYKANSDPVSLVIDDHIAGWFTQRVDDSCRYIYRLTTAFYKTLVATVKLGDEKINSLVYPSVESEITGYNIVMEQKAVRDNLEVGKATIFSLVHKDGSNYTLKPLRESCSIEPDGKIIWTDVTHYDLLTFNPDTPTVSFNRDQIFAPNHQLF